MKGGVADHGPPHAGSRPGWDAGWAQVLQQQHVPARRAEAGVELGCPGPQPRPQSAVDALLGREGPGHVLVGRAIPTFEEHAAAVSLGSSLLVALAWKISIHGDVVAGAVVIVALVFGSVALSLVPLVLLVGWARVALQDHTPAQALAGAALGALVAASVLAL